jgi:hypothetical protein
LSFILLKWIYYILFVILAAYLPEPLLPAKQPSYLFVPFIQLLVIVPGVRFFFGGITGLYPNSKAKNRITQSAYTHPATTTGATPFLAPAVSQSYPAKAGP